MCACWFGIFYKIHKILLSSAAILLLCALHALYAMDRGKKVSKGAKGFYGAKKYDVIEHNKVRILLCGNNVESCRETFSLLCPGSYQVTSVWSETSIVEALNSDGSRIDIILAEVNLLMENGGAMLRYIVHHEALQHVPVIILATRDQVSISVNGLRLGAADYLLKPLQAEELSHLWMHMQKRRAEVLHGCTSGIEGFKI